MRYKITEGPVARPQRLLVYGPEGIGKSTFASQMPDPLFIDVEDGTGHLYVMRLPIPQDWTMLVDECRSVAEDPGDVKSIVVDSIDAAERLCHVHICKEAKKPSIESWGYGKGYTIAAEKFNELLYVLDRCIAAGVNVILVAHSQMRKFERPDESGAYDRFEIKMHKLVASKVKEWSDAVLFIDYETFVSIDDNGKGHASGGKRVIRTSHDVSWDAKNRWGLPDKITLDADGINEIRNKLSAEHAIAMPVPSTPQPARETPAPPKKTVLEAKCDESDITLHEVKAVMVNKGKRDENQDPSEWEQPFVNWLLAHWDRVVELCLERRDAEIDIPFSE